jgi:hypothetical protein
MNFKYYLKCKWWHWLVSLPLGAKIYLYTKILLGKYPNIGSVSDERFKEVERYRDTFLLFGNKPINESVCFEFGAGYDLFMTMCLASFGFKKIISVDRVNWALPIALNFAAEHTKKRIGFPYKLPPPPILTQKIINRLYQNIITLIFVRQPMRETRNCRMLL